MSNWYLEDIRYDPIGHGLTVLVPGGAVLHLTVRLIPQAAVRQQQREVDRVEVWHQVVKSYRRKRCLPTPMTRGTPTEYSSQLVIAIITLRRTNYALYWSCLLICEIAIILIC